LGRSTPHAIIYYRQHKKNQQPYFCTEKVRLFITPNNNEGLIKGVSPRCVIIMGFINLL
jgi:hypothetical protein